MRAIRHGILGNNQFDPSIWAWDEDNYDRQPPYRDHSLIKVPTLWSAARSRGLKTAAVAWPQTFGGPIDYALGILLAAIDGAGLRDRTVIVVTGDHGFVQMHTQLAINLPLVEAGLIERDPQGHPRWQAIVAPNRGLGSLYLKDPKDQSVLRRAREALERYEAQYLGRFRLLSRAELDRMGADRAALLGVEPTLGYVLDARLGPPFAMAHDRAAGHGYSPELSDMQTGLIVAGTGIRRGVVLPVTQTIDIAPTIARILGLDLGSTDGRAIVGVLEREKK